MALTFDDDEVVVYEVRRHWFIISMRMLIIVVLFFMPLLAYSFIRVTPVTFITAEGSVAVLFMFLFMIWVLFIWILAMIFWTDYYLDVTIITNKRLIRVEQNGLFSREISYLDLENIQDVKSEVHGLIATYLNFGHLTVQTAAQRREFIIHSIDKPFETRDRLNQAIDLCNKGKTHTHVSSDTDFIKTDNVKKPHIIDEVVVEEDGGGLEN